MLENKTCYKTGRVSTRDFTVYIVDYGRTSTYTTLLFHFRFFYYLQYIHVIQIRGIGQRLMTSENDKIHTFSRLSGIHKRIFSVLSCLITQLSKKDNFQTWFFSNERIWAVFVLKKIKHQGQAASPGLLPHLASYTAIPYRESTGVYREIPVMKTDPFNENRGSL